VWQNGKKANLEKARERGSVCIVTSLWLDKYALARVCVCVF